MPPRKRRETAAPTPHHHAPAIELQGVQRRYGRGRTAVHALRGIDLALPHGSFTAVMGPSGCGKSTFLQCAAGLDRPTAGSVKLGGTEITGMSENKLTALRRARLGFVFQPFNLLPSLTVEQNVLLPMRLAGARPDRWRALAGARPDRRRARAVLAQVGLEDRTRRRPGELSGGQQQGAPPGRSLGEGRVHTGGGRGAIEEPALANVKEMLIALGGSFGGIATAVAVFTTAGTVALSVGRRGREVAVRRAIGATPRQIRRSVAAEALLVAPLAGAAGLPPGYALARWWFGQLEEKGAIPGPVELSVSWNPLVVAGGTGLLTSLLAGLLAARRPARIHRGGRSARRPWSGCGPVSSVRCSASRPWPAASS
ncbi:ABC transporter ATP-binding protein/permease [Streptomyces malaysiensis]|uniref:ABC transporter domain-containing protein n=1 Tax=Streptomyces malaysiensis TaxID=92644 RepID=A0A2J7ZAT0_STRMQ|nr:hypothetical protein SMF913_13408 [Streptomyces malaysiensis]